MDAQLKLETTKAELEYRTKHYYEITALKHRDLYCTSCGNIVSHESKQTFAHPVFRILQCRKCHEQITDQLNSGDLSSFCIICSKSQTNLYKCTQEIDDAKKSKCHFKFCQACLKRNASQALDKLSTKQWKCLTCRPRLLWKLRGLCDMVTGSSVERTKRERVSRDKSSETEEGTSLRNKSYVKRIQELKSKELTQRLMKICDEESPGHDTKFPNPMYEKNKNSKDDKNSMSKQKKKSFSSKGSVRVNDSSSSNSSDNESQKRVMACRKRKSRTSESRSRKNSSDDDSQDYSNDEKMRVKKRPRKSSTSEAASGKPLKSRKAVRKLEVLDCINEDESDSASSMERRKPSKSERDERRNQRTRKSSKESEKSKKTRRDIEISKKRDEISSRNKNSKDKKCNEETKLMPHEKLKLKKTMSDSSSGKEFCSNKIFRNSFVSLRKISDLEQDYTKAPEDSDEDGDVLTEDQTFGLKNNLSNYFTQLGKAAMKLVNDIESAKTKYCMKKVLKSTDIDRLILETKTVVTTLKDCVGKNENKMDDYYEKWCRKTKVRNVLKTNRRPDLKGSAKKSPNSRNESKREDKAKESMSRSSTRDRSVSPVESVAVNKPPDHVSMSECDSEAIFSGNESRNSTKERHPEKSDKNKNTELPKPHEKQPSDSNSSGDEKPASNKSRSDRNSVDPSDADIFETSIEYPVNQIDEEENVTVNATENKDGENSLKQSPKSNSKKERERNSPKSTDESRNLQNHSNRTESEKINDKSAEDSSSDKETEKVNKMNEILSDTKPNSPENIDENIATENIKSSREHRKESTDKNDDKKKSVNSETPILELSGSDTVNTLTEENEDNEHSGSIHSVDTVVLENTKDQEKCSSNSTIPIDDLIPALPSKVSSCEKIDETEKSKEDSSRRSKSPKIKSSKKLSIEKEKEGAKKKITRSSSPYANNSEQQSLENPEDNENNSNRISKSGEGALSSLDALLDDDILKSSEEINSKSESNVSQVSSHSDISESENLRARDMLLMSSNSDDSDTEKQSTFVNSFLIDSDNMSSPESSSSLKSKAKLENGSPEKQRTRKTKKKPFRIKDHPEFMGDKKLTQRCEVRLKRLSNRILRKHARALARSRDYVDSIKLKRLVDLDSLDKKKKINEDSSNDDSDCLENLNKKKKSKSAKEKAETLLDHLERVKAGPHTNLNSESDTELSDSAKERRNRLDDRSDDSIIVEMDNIAKKRLLESSDSDKDEPSASASQEKEKKDEKKEEKKDKKSMKKSKPSETPEDEEKKQEKSEKSRWRSNKLLTLRISDSDSDVEKEKFNKSQEKSEKMKKDGSHSESEGEKSPKKKRVRRRVLQSDSDADVSPPSDSESSDSNEETTKTGATEDKAKKSRKRIRKRKNSSSSDDSLEEKRPKTRRKRIKNADSDSDSDIDNSQETPGKAGRKNIRKVIKDKQVADDTKQAAKDEDERLQRIAERQKIYNQMYENRLAGEEKLDKLVLDFDEETKEPLVSVHEELVKRLKPHQATGIKFMWDACFESLERIKTSKGSGCILAHCMGLGKSFQIVALSHTLLSHEATGVKTVMVVCPLSTVLNWVNEFKIWLEHLPDGDDIEVYELTKMKQNFERKYQLKRWQETGGIMIIGYEMFRNLSNPSKKVRKNIQEAFVSCLVDPGADLIVCDEGHLLKNEDTALSKAMRRVRTLRRIVLTGTPLQNNLIEYHCMVQFVKPNLLGTKKEFTNRFENPITNGQFDDSTEYDVRLMKKRAHVLHKMLEGCVQRLDYSVLTPFLPPKQEYVIFLKLTEIQIKMYQHYLDNYARRHRGAGSSLFADFQALQRIWTHPLVMRMNAKKVELANEKKRLDDSESEGSLRDFIDDGSEDDSKSSNSSDVRSVSGSDADTGTKKRGTRANPVEEEPQPLKNEEPGDDLEWWSQYMKEEDYEDMRISAKLQILFSILKESHAIGDKVLVFSQSLYSLTLIEEFLRMIDDETQNGNEAENLDKHTGSWSLGLDYFRLDGQTSTDNRRRWCDIFNKPSNTRARLFLISTRAGGLGINLTAANRVVIFDASWNPSHDVQSIFRIYRFGQKKPCYVYRLLAAGTMEEKIYNRQVTKLSLSCRVVDEQQIERHYTNNALAELYQLEIPEVGTLNLPADRLLADIFLQFKHCVVNHHTHESLLENQAEEELDEEERKQAWLEYEEEKKGVRVVPQLPYGNYQNDLMMQQMNLMNAAQQYPITNPAMMLDIENLKQMISKDFPGISEAQQKAMAARAVYDMYNYVEQQARNQNPMNLLNMAGTFNNAIRPPGTNMPGVNMPGVNMPGVNMTRPNLAGTSQTQSSLMQQQNGQMNYQMRPGVNMMNGTNFLLKQLAGQPIRPKPPLSSLSTPTIDDDIVEIPASPDNNPNPTN